MRKGGFQGYRPNSPSNSSTSWRHGSRPAPFGYHRSALVYLKDLIKCANAGKFVPEAGLMVADVREKRRRNEANLQKLHALNDPSQLQETVVEDSRIARRLADIRLRSLARDKGG